MSSAHEAKSGSSRYDGIALRAFRRFAPIRTGDEIRIREVIER